MKRRKAIKNMVYISLGTGFLIACKDPFEAVNNLGLTQLEFQNDELKIIDQLSKLILPIQRIPALAEHTTLPFIMQSVHDLYSLKERKLFQSSYQAFNDYCLQRNEKAFLKMEEEAQMSEIEKVITIPHHEITSASTIDEKMANFLNVLKKENLNYLRTSEYILRNKRLYEMAPGRYDGEALFEDLMKKVQ